MSAPSELITDYLDGALAPADRAELCEWVKASPANVRQFVRDAILHSHLRDLLVGEQVLRQAENGFVAMAIRPSDPLAARVDEESERADGLRIAGDLTGSTPAPLANPRVRVRISSLLRSRWTMAAAVVLVSSIVAVVWFSQRQPSGVLTATVNAEWGDGNGATPPGRGGGLPKGELLLRRGVAQVTLERGTSLLIKGPTRFQIESPKLVRLTSGSLSIAVPHGVSGFTVQTPSARIIDLGTEFGVSADVDGITRVEVFVGRVQAEPLNGSRQVLSTGQAANVSAAGVQTDLAGSSPQHFVRSLLTEVAPLSVVDLVAGGDGITHRRDVGIDVATGKAGLLPQVATERGDSAYHRVNGLPVVDGCFIPDGSRGPVQIDSLGHTFTFPATTNESFNLIWAGGAIPTLPEDRRYENNQAMSASMGGIDYSLPGHACLAMHASKGLTLDLAQIRRLHPGQDLSRFACLVGNTWTGQGGDPKKPPLPAGFYVIIDGQERFAMHDVTAGKAPTRVEVPLNIADRFLTLVTLDSGKEVRLNWILVADPVIDRVGGGNGQ